MLLGSMLPSIDFDVLEYHLQGPKEYYQAGRIAFLPHNVYTNMPFNVEMLHLLAMEVMGDWWWGGLAGQLLVALFAPAAAILIAATAVRGGSARAGWIAALVYLSTPWIYRLAAIAYVEGPLCFYHAALILVALRGQRGDRCGDASLLGIARFAGGLCDGLQVHGIGLGCDSVWASRTWLCLAESFDWRGGLFCARLGDRDGSLAGEERGRHGKPGLSPGGDGFPGRDWDIEREKHGRLCTARSRLNFARR